MFNKLAIELTRRGVTVDVTGSCSGQKEQMVYRAEVYLSNYNNSSWPSFKFYVHGGNLDELAADIGARLHLVEPIIAAHEKHREHRAAVRKAHSLGEELADLCGVRNSTYAELRHPPLEPNTDAATAKEQPAKAA